ncbi:conserved hypothetical protein [Vibrio chagasii]|nr:conserved hypothetical protein [Vibrio chagasii]CAH7101516.1 conserved hypothetical protein [Vibrio chagasii]CAH7117470.1 conserved hypothetical protein [Vibrio chagasii]CAH7329704.1 conserved hypothetical protein [Vibrio chagasii]
MNVKYLIFSMDQGIGGHFISLDIISRAINTDHEVICIGYSKPLVDYTKVTFIDLNQHSIYSAFKMLAKAIVGCDLVHCFDEHSYFYGRIVSAFYKIPIVLTKCGGKITRYYPKAKDLIVFSREDYQYFKNRSTRCHFLPNRVLPIKNTDHQHEELGKKCFKILCIARIGSKYETKIRQSINLLNFYTKAGLSAELTVIGVVESADILLAMKNYAKGLNCKFLTDKEYTANASRHIPSYDLAIGTGRGVMEAFSYNVPCASSNSKLDLPLLITAENFNQLFDANFSERSWASTTSSENEKVLIDIINDKVRGKNLRSSYQDLFDENFNVLNVTSRYFVLYKKASPASFMMVDTLLNYLYLYYIKRQKLK